MRSLPLLCAAMLLCGCGKARDAAAEQPVDLQAGLYQVSVGGGTVVDMKNGGRSGEICLDSYSARTLPDNPLAQVAGSWDGCSTTNDPRKGNAIGGKRSCTARKMPMTVTYTGSVSQDSFEIHGTVAQGSDESSSVMHLGSGDFSITGKRTGDCSL